MLRRVSGPLREGLRSVIIADKLSAKDADMAADALVQNPNMSINTTAEQVADAVRRIRQEAKTPREPEPRMNLRGLLPAGQTCQRLTPPPLRDVQRAPNASSAISSPWPPNRSTLPRPNVSAPSSAASATPPTSISNR